MFSRSDEEYWGLTLGLVALTIVLVLSLVLLVVIGRPAAAGLQAVATSLAAVTPLAAATPMAALPSAQISRAEALAASDAASVSIESGVLKFYFASGRADLAPGAIDALAEVLEVAGAGRQIVISGFHDPSGDARQNVALADRRARAVLEALRTAGVAQSQITLRKPVAAASPESDAEARRVEISLQ